MTHPNRRSLEDLSNELLSNCFKYLRSSKEDIRSLRLVSQRCNIVCSEFLIDSARIQLTSESLSHLEDLSKHHVFSKSIKDVVINVSYYDHILATDRSLFAKHNVTGLSQSLDCYEHCSDPDSETDLHYLSSTIDEWSAVCENDFLEEKSTPRQRLLLAAHSEYQRRYSDQQQVQEGGAHLVRICIALQRFGKLRSIAIIDNPSIRSRQAQCEELSDEGLIESCLGASAWKGSFTTAFRTIPPVTFVPELFQALSISSVRPSTVAIQITPPNDLRCLQLREPQCQAIQTVLEQSQHLELRISRWARKDSYAVDNTRPHDEMLALGSLTSAFFNVTSVTTLDLIFNEYPVLRQRPTVTLVDLLPLTRSWPHLHKLTLHYIPCRIEELRLLVSALRKTLLSLNASYLFLVSGSWPDALDVLRGFEKLQSANISNPRGADIGDGRQFSRNMPNSEIGPYVMKLTERNPLRGLQLL